MKIQVEQKVELKDGRTVFKTHNGFRCWLIDTKGVKTQISDEYYTKARKLKV